MKHRVAFSIIYAPEVSGHVDAVEAKYHGVIQRSIYEQLSFAPGRTTRKRKHLEDQPGTCGSSWELLCGPANRFRLFYELPPE